MPHAVLSICIQTLTNVVLSSIRFYYLLLCIFRYYVNSALFMTLKERMTDLIKEKWPYILVIVILFAGGFIYSQCNQPKTEMTLENQLSTAQAVANPPEKEKVIDSVIEKKPQEEAIFVDIKGAVNKPGVYQMKMGDRVMDALERAGGLAKDADKAKVNFAVKLADEMMIYIPAKGETLPSGLETTQVASGSDGHDKNGKININTASEKELEEIPGIGPSKAAAIIEYREKNGRFKNIQDLDKVSGIGEKSIDRMEDQITVQ